MKKLLKHLQIYVVQQYFLHLLHLSNPSEILERISSSSKKPPPEKNISLWWRFLKLFLKKPFNFIENLFDEKSYLAKDYPHDYQFDGLYSLLISGRCYMNESIAIFVLRVIYTSHLYSGNWGFGRRPSPCQIRTECLRYINNKESLDAFAKEIFMFLENNAYDERGFRRNRLAKEALKLYEHSGNIKGALDMATYLWEKDHEIYTGDPFEMYDLLKLITKNIQHDQAKSLYKKVSYLLEEQLGGHFALILEYHKPYFKEQLEIA